ncbi:MAG: hypothetical protein CL677_10105 [Bdellovibrionaceae bacterium]|nr:hypothetical protein [Pseudobdellovibrionaceae bacterium]|tara:strand:+ start:48908 stop:49624 length:717 start_codon:yes stop_codon:yes gene_type:complete
MSKSIALPQRHMALQPKQEDLAKQRAATEARLRQASQMYEQRFLNSLVKQMRRTVPESDLVKKNFAQQIYEQKMDENTVEKWTNKGGIGLADLIYNQMHEKMYPKHMGRAQGPVPIEKPAPMGIEKEQEPAFKIIKPPEGSAEDPTETSFIFQKIQTTPGSTPVSSPWKGTVTNLVPSTDQQLGLITIQHEHGLESKISHRGGIDSNTVVGAQVEAGQKIGEWPDSSNSLYWKVRLKS